MIKWEITVKQKKKEKFIKIPTQNVKQSNYQKIKQLFKENQTLKGRVEKIEDIMEIMKKKMEKMENYVDGIEG